MFKFFFSEEGFFSFKFLFFFDEKEDYVFLVTIFFVLCTFSFHYIVEVSLCY